ncbi:hypothetical protein OS493_034603 [Desmophyllum pertusum]|uniref:Uncharacterized protein n=1 Tax=Desmophyllum pertusum TaxID=174260 RepID=A0A9X0D6V0_9CNID|nr:hypothetical protein OS493_034603 [Desmophyllum pertusum]
MGPILVEIRSYFQFAVYAVNLIYSVETWELRFQTKIFTANIIQILNQKIKAVIMSSVPISTVYVRRLQINNAALAGKKMESSSTMSEYAETAECKKVGIVQQSSYFSCFADAHLRASTKKLFWFTA